MEKSKKKVDASEAKSAAKSVTITVRCPADMPKRITAVCDNRNQFILEAIEAKLTPVKGELTDAEKKAVLKGAKNISDLMRDAILAEAQRRENFLEHLSNEDFARLVSTRLPKEDVGDADLEGEVLSLRNCIDRLPAMEDVTEELNRVKLENKKLELRNKTMESLLRHVQHKETFFDLMDGIYRGVVEYCVEMVTRNALPGIGDGGGLSEAGYRDVSERVKEDLAKLEIIGKAGKW